MMRRSLLIIAFVVVLLQLPYTAHQVSSRFSESGMGVVSESVRGIISGRMPLQFAKSLGAYAGAFTVIQVWPWQIRWAAWVLVPFGAIVALSYRDDPALLAVILLPQIAAIVGYASFLGDLITTTISP